MRPEGIKAVVPVNTAEFLAARWDGSDFDPNVAWLATRYGWRLLFGTNNDKPMLRIYGRNGKRYEVREGDWAIALGANGSIRVCSDKQYRQDYREASA